LGRRFFDGVLDAGRGAYFESTELKP